MPLARGSSALPSVLFNQASTHEIESVFLLCVVMIIQLMLVHVCILIAVSIVSISLVSVVRNL